MKKTIQSTIFIKMNLYQINKYYNFFKYFIIIHYNYTIMNNNITNNIITYNTLQYN